VKEKRPRGFVWVRDFDNRRCVHCPRNAGVLESTIGVIPYGNDVESPLANAIRFTKSGVTHATQLFGMLFQGHAMHLEAVGDRSFFALNLLVV
jgi:hypothetical protein